MRTLIIDADPVLRRDLARRLAQEGQEVYLRHTADDPLPFIAQHAIDLVILDTRPVALRGAGDFCQAVREQSNAMLLLVSREASVRDRVRVLDAGADDLLTEPFDLDELLARIHALSRRRSVTLRKPNGSLVQVTRDLLLDLNKQVLFGEAGELPLTRTEFQMLTFFMRHEGTILNREAILAGVWGLGYEGSAREVDVYVRYLRQKLEPAPSQPQYLVSIWGRGYQYRGPAMAHGAPTLLPAIKPAFASPMEDRRALLQPMPRMDRSLSDVQT